MTRCFCEPSGELGIALSGGGARGLAQLGVLKVLDREGVTLSFVSGTSAGAIVGAAYVLSRDAAEAEQRVLAQVYADGVGFNARSFGGWDTLKHRSRVVRAARGLWDTVSPGRAEIRSEAMRASLRILLGDGTFRSARLPFATTALDLVSGRRMIFADGDIVDAVYASSAIPGLFQPLEIDGHVLVDGGWAEPVPVDTCHHLGAVHVLAVDLARLDTYDHDAQGMAIALRADALARDLLEDEHLQKADFVVRLDAPPRSFADFTNIEELITAGERAAESVLDSIQAVIERHHSLFVRAESPPDARMPDDPPLPHR